MKIYKLCEQTPLHSFLIFPITICRTENLSGTQNFVRNTSRQSPLLRAIIGVWKLISEVQTIGGDDMADIAKKITKLDEKIGKLKERIKTDTAECEKLSEQKSELDKKMQTMCRKRKAIDTKPLEEPMKQWDKLTVREKYDVAAAMIDVVLISDETGIEVKFSI